MPIVNFLPRFHNSDWVIDGVADSLSSTWEKQSRIHLLMGIEVIVSYCTLSYTFNGRLLTVNRQQQINS